MSEMVYYPPDSQSTNIMRLARKHGLQTLDNLYDRADADPEWFWPAVIEDCNITFRKPYGSVMDASGGKPWTKWFTKGHINIAHNCVEKFGDSDRPAVKYETEDGRSGSMSFRELNRVTGKLGGFLREAGIARGDRVGIYMPPSLEGVVALYSVLRIGAVAVPVFSGYGIEAVKTRIQDSGAKALFSFAFYSRKGKTVDMQSTVHSMPEIMHIVKDAKSPDVFDFWKSVDSGKYVESADTESEDPAIMLYTSGTTGKPKGTVHVHGGSFVNIVKEVKYYMDMRPEDTLFWISDLGWMMGPWSILGANALGGSIFVYDGAVDYPDIRRLWRIISSHGITLLGLSPTLVRSLKSRNAAFPMPSVRVFGSTGEPWDEESWLWLFREIGSGKTPIANISGGTDIIGCFLASTPAIPLMPRCLYRGLGMNTSVMSEDGVDVVDQVGYLVSKSHCPSMTRGIWGQTEKYLETYWSQFKDVWVQGDWAMRDRNGYYFLFGRSDDVIKVSGKRLGPNEIENAVMEVPGVVESAVIGVPDALKGEAVVIFYTGENSDATMEAIRKKVEESMGKSFLPRFTIWLPQLPKTRNGKIVRRVVKRAFLGQDPGDVSNLEDTAIMDYITEVGRIRDRPDDFQGMSI